MDIKNIVLGIVIFILTMSVGIYGINTLYGKAPEYTNFCPYLNTYEDCINSSGKWINNTYIPDPQTKPIPIEGGYCEFSSIKCEKEFNDANRVYTRNVFFIAMPLDIIIIAIGALVFVLVVVGAGLMAGGVGLILYGIGQVWQYADEPIKFVISLIGLIAVIALAYYANYKWNKKR